MDPKEIVAKGYDQIAEYHSKWAKRTRAEERQRYTQLLLESLPEGAHVLDLGCGTGSSTTHLLARRFQVTGIDLSERHIELARQQIPQAKFIQADMTAVTFPPASFEAVTAFYSIIQVPREEQAALFSSIASWLKPGGLFVAALGATDVPWQFSPNWLGAPMYWSHFDSQENQRLVREAGLQLVSAKDETADEDGVPVTFLWVVAQKPLAPA